MTGPTFTNFRQTFPKITLPQFSGNYYSWRSFHDLFFSMIINNPDLSDVERMHYLKTSLSGEAARLILSLPVSGDTFSIAWKTLIGRYENKRILITTQLDKILNLKPVKAKSARDLSQLLANISESINALQALNFNVQQENPLFLHLIVRLLETREAWELKLGSYTEYPTFDQFHEFLISRTRAFETLHSSSSTMSQQTNRSIRSYVATTTGTVGGYTCRLCKSQHYLSSGPKFLAFDVYRRHQEVNKLKVCYNCLGHHPFHQCTSSRRCRRCGKKHHITLRKYTEKVQSTSSSSNKEISNNKSTDSIPTQIKSE